MKYILAIAVCLLSLLYYPTYSYAKPVKGKVLSADAAGKQQPLSHASVFWMGSTVVVMTDGQGQFTINRLPNSGSATLIATFTGYSADTLTVAPDVEEVTFVLTEGVALEGAVVGARKSWSYISKLAPVKSEVITSEGLSKMACCNLAESFENTATVSVGYSDAVTGARQIRMLGLAGTYTQMLDENIPTHTGLASTYGLSYTPGPWLESIQISKGTPSVINGYESIAGQINMEDRKPDRSSPLFVNLFASSEERYEGNIASAVKLNDKLSTIVLLHGSADTKLHDRNGDGFADLPKTRQLNVGNRWLYNNDKVMLHFGVGFLDEAREGGQLGDAHNSSMMPSPSTPLYQTQIDNRHFNAYTKVGIPFGGELTSLGFIASYSYHDEQAGYGDLASGGRGKRFDGDENSVFAKLIFQSAFGMEWQHKYAVGASFRYDRLSALYTDALMLYNAGQTVDFGRDEAVTGAFAEYTYSPSERLSVIAGARVDYNTLYGTLFTPRAHLKYSFLEHTTLRASAGRGFRSTYLIPDNMGILANSRQLVVDPKSLDIEEAWTYGVSLTQDFPLSGGRKATLSVDAFRSDFVNQVMVDAERDAAGIYVYNLNGASYANSFQVDFSIEPFERFTALATFRYTDNEQTMSHARVEKPLVDRYRALLNVAYATRFDKWKLDFTAQLNGRSRIPTRDGNMSNSDYSPVFPMFYAQVTKKFKRLDVYLGCENIGDYRQDDPIIHPEDPFGTSFDASGVWGPLMGRTFYMGIRLTLGKIL